MYQGPDYRDEINMNCNKFSKNSKINRGNTLNDFNRRIFTKESYEDYYFSNFSSRSLLDFFRGITNEEI